MSHQSLIEGSVRLDWALHSPQAKADSPLLHSLVYMTLGKLIHLSEPLFLSKLHEPTPGIKKCHPCSFLDSTHIWKENENIFINWENQNEKFSSLGTSEKEPWIGLSRHQIWKSLTKKMLKSLILQPKERKTGLLGRAFLLHRKPIWGWSHYQVFRPGPVTHLGTEGRDPDCYHIPKVPSPRPWTILSNTLKTQAPHFSL